MGLRKKLPEGSVIEEGSKTQQPNCQNIYRDIMRNIRARNICANTEAWEPRPKPTRPRTLEHHALRNKLVQPGQPPTRSKRGRGRTRSSREQGRDRGRTKLQ